MTLDDVAVLQVARRGLPARRETFAEDLLGGRPMVPDRDQANCAQSSGSVHEPSLVRERNEDVVRELVLLDDVDRAGWR
jgi:hypothetical protein